MVNVIARDARSEKFFDAAADGVLMAKHCDACSEWSEPAALRCTHCHSAQLSWGATQGRGSIASWVVIPPGRSAPEGTPSSIVAVVELTEGPWVTMAMPQVNEADVLMGMPVTVAFEQPEGGEFVPVAIPA